ncbi:dihydroorotate dehydrogenase [Intrasporangium sp.]|uniref:dihydroorotate dehydrogenase n=1 Tax=Intrasporangium sp. TaxID=1925024 RepID=UPI00293A01EC|nr:dihydroorotate dehydrogenase [Intrasporangium sp.]MDV3221546.1 dihydroorotate dehydrogenase [Intrasporangium sp.]
MADLSVTLGGRRLRNAVMTASGCGGSGRELHRFFDVAELGAVVTPSVSLAPRAGCGTPRLVETPCGVLSDTGLPGPGVTAFVAHELPWLRAVGATVLPSVAGSSPEEYATVSAALSASPAFDCAIGVELNLSVASADGIPFDEDALAADAVVRRVRERLGDGRVVIVKLAVDAPDLVAVAAACVRAGADALTIGNGARGTAVGLAPEPSAVVNGRLSGPAARTLAVRAVWEVHRAMREGRVPTVPIVGVGGVRSGRDALELITAGASAVQVGSATFVDPRAPARVRDELSDLLDSTGHRALGEAIATAHRRQERNS